MFQSDNIRYTTSQPILQAGFFPPQKALCRHIYHQGCPIESMPPGKMLMTSSLENSLTTAPQLTTRHLWGCRAYLLLLLLYSARHPRHSRLDGQAREETSRREDCWNIKNPAASSIIALAWIQFMMFFQFLSGTKHLVLKRILMCWTCPLWYVSDNGYMTNSYHKPLEPIGIWYSAMCFRVLLYCWSVHIKKLSPIPCDSRTPVYCLPEGMFVWA